MVGWVCFPSTHPSGGWLGVIWDGGIVTSRWLDWTRRREGRRRRVGVDVGWGWTCEFWIRLVRRRSLPHHACFGVRSEASTYPSLPFPFQAHFPALFPGVISLSLPLWFATPLRLCCITSNLIHRNVFNEMKWKAREGCSYGSDEKDTSE